MKGSGPEKRRFLHDEQTDELYFAVALGEKSEQVTRLRLPLSKSGIAGWVFFNQLPLVVNDVSKDPRYCKDVDKAARPRPW